MKEPVFPSFEELKALPDSPAPYEFSISLPGVSGHHRMLKLGSMVLTGGVLELSEKAAGHGGLQHFNDMPLVEMNFVLEGNILQQHSYLKEPLFFTKGYHNLMYNQGGWEHNRFLGSGHHNTFSINIHTDRFIQLFSPYSAQMEQMVEKITRQTPFLFQQPRRPFTLHMLSVINALWSCPLTGSLKSLFMESKMLELLLLQWEMFSQPRPVAALLKEKQELEKLYLAREILLKDIQHPPSLAQLARDCGLNEFKLKKGFKAVFNNTVFGYFNAVRLEQARQLILHTGKTISEIAYQTGYAHPQHFQRAFKKQFGMAPGQLRK